MANDGSKNVFEKGKKGNILVLGGSGKLKTSTCEKTKHVLFQASHFL